MHVVSVDTVGNVGSEADHYQVNIDANSPVVTIVSPLDGATVATDFLLSWAVTETGSGYSSARVYVNGSLSATVSAPLTNTTLTSLPDGTYPLNVTVFDASGLSGSHQITITVGAPPMIPGFPFGAIAIGTILAVSLGVLYRRRKR